MVEGLPFLVLLGAALVLFFGVEALSKTLKLSPVPLYIILGLLFSGLVFQEYLIYGVAEVGIVLLFFLLGLEYPLDRMVSISRRIWPGGTLDVALNLGLTSVFAWAFGVAPLPAFLIGGVAYASSSSITLRMLEDKKRLANPETDFMVALLVFEDIAAPVLVTTVTVMYIGGHQLDFPWALSLIARVVLMIGGAVLLARFGFRNLRDFLDEYIEEGFFVLIAVGIALAYSGLAVALGLSELLGAFLAGVMMAEIKRPHRLHNSIMPIRRVTLPFLFFWFGTQISIDEGFIMIPLLVVLIVWAIAAKLIVGVLGGRIFGLSPKAALKAGLSLVQRGEFSVIIAALAVPAIRSFSGIYILITCFIGMLFFFKAPKWSRWIYEKIS